MKQTAVEWLMDKLFDPTFDKGKQIDWFEQAIEMEKEQIIQSNRDGVDMIIDEEYFITGEEYYNETFKQQIR